MVSKELHKKISDAMHAYWHYNDEGKAYEPEGWVAFMVQYRMIQRKYFRCQVPYDQYASQYAATGSMQTIAAEPVVLEDEEAIAAMEKLEALRAALVQVNDPAAIKTPLWNVGNIPDMTKNPEVHFVTSQDSKNDPMDPPDYMPSFTPYWVEDGKDHPMIFVCAGGDRSNHGSGDNVARFYNSIGYHAAVMGHRVGPVLLNYCLDLQRAVRYVRYHAKELHVESNHIGAIGLSFGGCVVIGYVENIGYADIPNKYDPAYQPDAIDEMPGELNAVMGIYSSSDPFVPHNPVVGYGQYPPVFMVEPQADPMIPFQTGFIKDLIDNGIRVEAHIFDRGVHGFGLGDGMIAPNGKDGEQIPAIELWPKLNELWLRRIFA